MSRQLPIPFNGKMVRAILLGIKTQTRRPLDRQPSEPPDEVVNVCSGPVTAYWHKQHLAARCRQGAPGDRLYVRETYRIWPRGDEMYVDYRATTECHDHGAKWTPSIHMPKSLARIWLGVANIRLQRLADISEEDAKAEGATPVGLQTYREAFIESWNQIYKPMYMGGGDNDPGNLWLWATTFEVETK